VSISASIQALLGHAKLNTTAFYTQLATKAMRGRQSAQPTGAAPEPEAPGG